MIDRSVVGRETASEVVTVERSRVRLFAQLLGYPRDGVHRDLAAARAAGHPDLVVPPTYLAGLETETGAIYRTLDDVGVDLATVLNGEQHFTYHCTLHAGDEIVFTTRVADVYARGEGRLEFLVRETAVTRSGEPVAELRNTVVVVNAEVSA
ncbi:MaoC dehydratase-like protein [Actinomycetospora succinea]|uniref:MaoC dehydratase-like protein n=1 Tax=Actinomycetospora succinea TaxID=663603 RepID=A0A4R6VQL3_9PSEU|nr:MaoC family dehydratase N-terminal domain-containing protein [Actinomycetospora succinea]TDQ64794.1 MaoC dehydratase-like protein [Actinomycetospora succinea]